MKRVLLVGAGHAQLAVLGDLARARLPGAEVTLVTPNERVLYSGMVPGLIAGRHARADCEIDIAALAARAGVAVRWTRAVALDAAARRLTLANGEALEYDLLSMDTGSTQDRHRIPGAGEHALFLRPIESFATLWGRTRELAREQDLSVVVIGSGAAGVEVVLAVRAALGPGASVSLVGDGALLPQYPPRLQHLAQQALRRRHIDLLPGRCHAIERWHVMVGSMRVACDVPILAVGADGPAWLAGSGLALDERGFVRIGPTLQSTSHPEVLAAGDMSVRDDTAHPRSGVYAVRAGPALAANLRALATAGTPRPWQPQTRSLNLLALGDGHALASWGNWAAQGRLMGWWKDLIDRRFIQRWNASSPG